MSAETTTKPETRTTTASSDRPRVVRLSINLAPTVAETLKTMATKQNLSITDAVRRAIGLWKLVTDETAKGNRIVVMEGNGSNARQRELVILD